MRRRHANYAHFTAKLIVLPKMSVTGTSTKTRQSLSKSRSDSRSHSRSCRGLLHPRSCISKTYTPTVSPSSSAVIDLLTCLPSDLIVHIIDQLSANDLRRLPLVCKKWAALFDGAASTEPLFRAIVRHRFGIMVRPPCAAGQSWGRLYLALRRERCHLCPNPYIAPFVYAASGALSLALVHHPLSHLVLFPVCRSCFDTLLMATRHAFIPVIEHSSLPIVFPAVPEAVYLRAHVSKGYLYSDIPSSSEKQTSQSTKPISYVLARPISNQLSEPRSPTSSSSSTISLP